MLTIKETNYSNNQGLNLVLDGQKMGIQNSLTGVIVVPYEYEDIISFRDRYFSCLKDGIYTLYDNTGHILVPSSEGVSNIIDREDGDSLLLVYYNPVFDSKSYKILSLKSGQLSKYTYTYIHKFYDHVAPYIWGGVTKAYYINSRRQLVPGYGKYGLISDNNHIIMWADYSYIGRASEGYVVFAVDGKWSEEGLKGEQLRAHYQTHLQGAKWGVATTKGKIVIEAKYDFIRRCTEGKVVYREGDQYGYIDIITGNKKDAVFDDMKPFSEGLAPAARYINGKLLWGYVDENYSTIIDFKYDDAFIFVDSEAQVKDGWYDITIDRNGNVLYIYDTRPDEDTCFGYSQEDNEDMYRAAFEGDPSAQWNID